MNTRKENDLRVVKRFIEVYCAAHHGQSENNLCAECSSLMEYASTRLDKCPYDPKPKCRNCATHCYRPEYREKIQEVMRFSGMHFVRRGRLDWLIKYFLG